MNQIIARLPSQIKDTSIIRMSNSTSFLEYEIVQNIDCKEAYEWDIEASSINQSAIAQIQSVDFQKGRITLQYEKKQLLSKVENKKELDHLFILYQLIEACYQLHKRQLLGRCLSTSSIEIDEQSNIKIYRYGFIHNLLNNEEIIQLSPETLFEDKVQISSDIWLIGMIIYELVFNKQMAKFVYPHQYNEYKYFIEQNMEANTFEGLYDNLIDSKISTILQLLLIFDAETRLSSYLGVLYQLLEFLPQYKQKLMEMLKFYETDANLFSATIQRRSKQRNPPTVYIMRSKKSKSLDNLQQSQETNLLARKNFKRKIGIYSYTKSVRPIKKIYELSIIHKEKSNEENVTFCKNIHFQLYQISFLIHLRQLISSLTNKTEHVNLDKFLLKKTEQIINLQVQNLKLQQNKLFLQELNYIQAKLLQLKSSFESINKCLDSTQVLGSNLDSQIQELKQELSNNYITNQIALEIVLRILIAQNIEQYLADKSSVNLYFFPMKFFLGLNQITEPEEIERYLQRSPIGQKLCMQNLLKSYSNEVQKY